MDELLSASDRGYLYGDALFETVRVVSGEIIWEASHRARFERSVEALGFDRARARSAWQMLRSEAPRRDGLWRVTLSRDGAEERGISFGGEGSVRVRWRALSAPSSEPLTLCALSGLYSPEDELAEHKTTSYIRSVEARRRARAAGYQDALRVTRSGRVGEASAGNVFVIGGGGEVATPSAQGVVGGVMREQLIAALGERGVQVEQREVWLEEVASCRALWLTSVGVGVLSAASFEGRALQGDEGLRREAMATLGERGWR